jgi:hypothetical protein
VKPLETELPLMNGSHIHQDFSQDISGDTPLRAKSDAATLLGFL